MAKKTASKKEATKPATTNLTPTPAETPEQNGKQSELTYLCSACSKTYGTASEGVTTDEDGKPDYTNAKMWAKPKTVGAEHEPEAICAECKALAEEEAKAAGNQPPVYHPLLATIERDKRWVENRARYEERKLNAETNRDNFLGKLYDQSLRTVREDVVCHVCGKYHGFIQYFKPRGERFTVIEHATTAVKDGKTMVLPICRSCRAEAAEALGDQYHDVYFREAVRQTADANAKAEKFAAFVKPATPRYIPRGKRG
ncbi:MAG: hypothetical protein NTZ49_01660 [Candidatus Parcubacteria bacterium]|nr:hypothetical protein [Candidatus Parcubacteria bacterium]